MTGEELWHAGRILSVGTEEEVAALYAKYPNLRSTVDIASRCKRLYRILPAKYIDRIPDGIAAARELSKFGDKLASVMERKLITKNSDRYHVDRVYEQVIGKRVARRHRPTWD